MKEGIIYVTATPYARSVPFGNDRLEDVALQYIPAQRQLVVTFYYQGVSFALFCLNDGGALQPIRVVHHLRKDDGNLRVQLMEAVLNDRLEELYRAVSSAGPGFRAYVHREIGADFQI